MGRGLFEQAMHVSRTRGAFTVTLEGEIRLVMMRSRADEIAYKQYRR